MCCLFIATLEEMRRHGQLVQSWAMALDYFICLFSKINYYFFFVNVKDNITLDR